MTSNWNLRTWYTMSLWENEKELTEFYRSGTHLEAMKQSKSFSSQLQSTRMQKDELLSWKEAKKLFSKK